MQKSYVWEQNFCWGYRKHECTAYIKKELAHIGIDLYYQTVVGDNKERVWNVLDTALKRSDLIIMTGGLGPTKDDLTKEVAASFLGRN